MRELRGLEFDELGAVLGISDSAAKQTVYDARQALGALDAGRSMDCEQIRELLAAGDRAGSAGGRSRERAGGSLS